MSVRARSNKRCRHAARLATPPGNEQVSIAPAQKKAPPERGLESVHSGAQIYLPLSGLLR
jgi:hypothetical protein